MAFRDQVSNIVQEILADQTQWPPEMSRVIPDLVAQSPVGGAWPQSGGLALIWDSLASGISSTGLTAISTPTLPTRFTHLVVHWQGSVNAAGAFFLGMRINGDSGAHYYGQRVVANNAAPATTSEVAVTRMIVGLLGGSTNTTYRGSGVIHIPNYNASSVALPVTSVSSMFTAATAAGTWSLQSTYMKGDASTNVTSLTFLDTAGNAFLSNCRFTVFGLGLN